MNRESRSAVFYSLLILTGEGIRGGFMYFRRMRGGPTGRYWIFWELGTGEVLFNENDFQ